MAKPGVNQPETKASKLDHGRWDFVKLAPLMGGLSLLATILSIAVIMVRGFNYGIDFAGGTEVQVRFADPVQTADLKNYVDSDLGIKNATVQSFGDNNDSHGKPPHRT